jgi:hypothetical protein
MSVTRFHHGYVLNVVGDGLLQANCGHAGNSGPFVARVSSIELVATGATSATELKAGGVTIYSGTPTASDTSQIVFAAPTDLADLTVTTLSANLKIVIHVV